MIIGLVFDITIAMTRYELNICIFRLIGDVDMGYFNRVFEVFSTTDTPHIKQFILISS